LVLFLHNRYRTLGGEERVARDLLWLVRDRLGEDAEILERDSAVLGRGAAARGMLGGGLDPDEVGRAVRRTRARVVHAHNVNPAFGWRALAAARDAGARVVLHLHQYRLVCAVGVCFTAGAECTRCHGRNTLPGVVRRCRGSVVEAAVYGAGLALWQRRLAAQVDAFVVPSAFARGRLEALGAPLGPTFVLPPVIREFASASPAGAGGYALYVGRLAEEKGVDVAIEACRLAGTPLVVAGDGPLRPRLSGARFVGRVTDAELAGLRAGASVAVVPSRSAETFGLAAAEAMATGLPVAASRVGALPELVESAGLVAAGDPAALAAAILRLRGDAAAGDRALARVRSLTAPEVVAPALAAVYAGSTSVCAGPT
jgi:glycosyltransferase involved in cell wall biosynthesis